MKKNDQDTKLFNPDIASKEKYFEKNNIKTTNVNILLNRVRLDKKKILRKRIFFSITLISLVSMLAVYFVV